MYMQIDIYAKNVELNPPLRLFIEEKMKDVEHLLGDAGDALMKVEVGVPSHHHNTGPKFYAEANLTTAGHLLRAEATHHDLHSAIIDVKEDLKVQIKKFKERLTDATRKPSAA